MKDIGGSISNSTPLLGEIDIKRWKQKRKETFLMYILHRFSTGFSMSMIISSLISYVTHELNLSTNAELGYGLISSGRSLPLLLLGIPMSRWFDSSRHLKRPFILLNIISGVGYAIYMIPTSFYFPVVGSILFGFGYVARILLTGEIFRVYKSSEIQRQYLIGMFAFGVGKLFGPLTLIIFKDVDIWIGALHVTYGNLPGLISLCLTIIRIILACFFVHDLSKEYDLKEEEGGHLYSQEPGKWYNFGKYIDSYFILVNRLFVVTLAINLFPLLTPLLTETLNYSNTTLNIIIIAGNVLLLVSLVVVRNIKSSGVYYLGLASLILIIIGYTTIIVLKWYNTNDAMNYIFLGIFVFCTKDAFAFETTFTSVTIGKLHPSSNQSFIEGLNDIIQSLGMFIAALASAYIYKYHIYCLPPFSLIMLLLLVGLVVRKKTLIDPHVT